MPQITIDISKDTVVSLTELNQRITKIFVAPNQQVECLIINGEQLKNLFTTDSTPWNTYRGITLKVVDNESTQTL